MPNSNDIQLKKFKLQKQKDAEKEKMDKEKADIEKEKELEKQKKEKQAQFQKSRQDKEQSDKEKEQEKQSATNGEGPPGGQQPPPQEPSGNVYPSEPSEKPVKSDIKPLPERGKRFLSKEGDWVITQTEIGEHDGTIKIVNQDTLDEIFLKYKNGKWVLRVRDKEKKKNLRLSSSNYEMVMKKAVEIFERGGVILENFELKELIRGIVKELQQEVSQTGAIAGYSTPRAFVDRRNTKFKNKRRNFIDRTTSSLGYTRVQDLEDADPFYSDDNPVFENTVYDRVIQKLKDGYFTDKDIHDAMMQSDTDRSLGLVGKIQKVKQRLSEDFDEKYTSDAKKDYNEIKSMAEKIKRMEKSIKRYSPSSATKLVLDVWGSMKEFLGYFRTDIGLNENYMTGLIINEDQSLKKLAFREINKNEWRRVINPYIITVKKHDFPKPWYEYTIKGKGLNINSDKMNSAFAAADEAVVYVQKKLHSIQTEGRRGKYHEYRDDDTQNSRQKIGHALKSVRNQLSEIEKTIDLNLRLKQETGIDSRDYWKNTHRAMRRISERLMRLQSKIRKF